MKKYAFTELANPAELTYRNEIQLTEDRYREVADWIDIVTKDGYLEVLPYLRRRGIEPRGKGLELGAGMCWLSAQLSTLPQVERMHALDLSEKLLSEVAPPVIRGLGGNLDKIEFHVGDFHDLSMFDSAAFDFVAVDAALHHTNHVVKVLSEAHRVLVPSGILLAVNEPGIPRVTTPLTRASPEHFGAHERQFGVIENTFREEEWREMFEQVGFTVRFIPRVHRRRSLRAKAKRYTPLRWLNGVLFWSKVVVARKPA